MNKILMSKGMGKVLDSKMAKMMIPIGDTIKKILPNKSDFKKQKDFENMPGNKMKEQERMDKAGLSMMKKKGRSTSDGYMRG